MKRSSFINDLPHFNRVYYTIWEILTYLIHNRFLTWQSQRRNKNLITNL